MIFIDLHAFLNTKYRQITETIKRDPAAFWQQALFGAFWLSLAFFPIGYGFREAMPPVCFVFLLLYYRYGWQGSVLKRLRIWPLFLCLLAMILIGVIFSIHPWQSLLHAGTGINKAYILPFIAMESVRDSRQLKALVWAMVLACFWEGLDGIWQICAGADFIMGYTPNAGRLTGSLGDYTVGNYLALAMIPAFGVWFLLRQKFPLASAWLLFVALFWPSFVLFLGASSRSGVLALAGCVFLWQLLTRSWKDPRVWLYSALIFLTFHFLQPGRLAPDSVINDNRWDLWRLGWKVFCEHPLFGAGAGQYNAAFREMGLSPVHEAITISHPHNLYLDLLYAHGLTGFCLGMIFILGFAIWGYARIRPHLNSGALYWRLLAWFWLGYIGWLLNGIFGHDFYRIWWLAEAMGSLGIMIGGIINAPRGGSVDADAGAPS